MSTDMFPDSAMNYLIETSGPTVELLASEEDPVFGVYYYENDASYITPWSERTVQRLAEAEDGRGKFYFVIDVTTLTVREQSGTGVGTRTPGWTLADCGHLECTTSCQ